MKAFITINLEWLQRPSKNLVYYFLINGFEKIVTEPQTQVCLWDHKPCLQNFIIEILVERKTSAGILGNKDNVELITRSNAKFSRKINQKITYNGNQLSLNNYLIVNDLTCSVSGFVIPEYNHFTNSSYTCYETATHPIEVHHISKYFQIYNAEQLLSNQREDEEVVGGKVKEVPLLRIVGIGGNYEENDRVIFPVYYESYLGSPGEEKKIVKETEPIMDEDSDSSSTSSSEEEKKEELLVDLL